MTSRRQERVNEQLRQEISAIVHREMNDPRLSGVVSFTAVRVSPDLGAANVFFSVLGEQKSRDEALDALRNASGFVRRELAGRLVLKRTPSLTFYFDDTLDRGNRIAELIDAARNSTKQGQSES
jgi:ribosome-binding factor A